MVEQIPARQDVLVSGALIGPTMPLRRALAILDSRPTSHPDPIKTPALRMRSADARVVADGDVGRVSAADPDRNGAGVPRATAHWIGAVPIDADRNVRLPRGAARVRRDRDPVRPTQAHRAPLTGRGTEAGSPTLATGQVGPAVTSEAL